MNMTEEMYRKNPRKAKSNIVKIKGALVAKRTFVNSKWHC